MREIKFRAWNGKEFVDTSRLTLDDLENNQLLDFQQFTGLKDKNGVEIFEGDICHIGQLPNDDDAPDGIDKGNTEIWFCDGKFLTRYFGYPLSSWACNDKMFVEVHRQYSRES